MRLRIASVIVGFLLVVLSLAAQTASNSQAASQVPPLIQFSSVATDEGGSSLSGVVNITFSLYAAQRGGEPLWTETQNNVQLDSTGHYSVQLGITKANGVPTTLFTSGEARWLGVRIAEQTEQARVLLLSVPYALKAGDAATIGGLPPSAFVLAAPASVGSDAANRADTGAAGASPTAATDVTTTGGTVNYLPVFTGTSTVLDSVVFQSGTGATAKIGINTATPLTTLDIKGASTVRGILSLPVTGNATATAGKNSQPLSLAASAYNSGTPAAVNQTFRWQAEPAGNNTATPSGTLNLLFAQGTAVPAETGLHIASNGQITFATGQTFPGSGGGSGTVTSVATGLGLKGGPITTSGTLTIDTTVVPRLGAANTFTGNQTLNGTLTVASSGSTIVAGTGSASDPAIQGNGISFGIEGNASTTNGTGIFGFGADGVVGESSLANGNGVIGVNTSTTGTAPGVSGGTSSATGYGVWGGNNSTTGNAVGVFGTTSSAAGYGVEGAVNAPNGAAVVAENNSTTGNAFGLFASSASPNGWGVEGTAPVGVYGVDSLGSGLGVLGQSNSGTGIQGQTNSGAGASGLSATGDGVYGQTYSPTAYGVVGENFAATGTAPGVYGTSSSPTGYGVEGLVSAPNGAAVYGANNSTTGDAVGVYGTSSNGYGVYATGKGTGVFATGGDGVVGIGNVAGVVGLGVTESETSGYILQGAGVWGDTGGTTGEYVAVAASADSNIALVAANTDNSGVYPTMFVENLTTATHNPVFQTSSPNTYSNTRHCTIDTSANLTCTGLLTGSIQGDAGKQTAVYAMQSAENWLEDAGSGQLSNGSARIELDPAFAQTVNAGVEYHVFLTPKGDCKGLYVTNESPSGFGVRELSGGTSSIAFDYRIMAKRKGYETVRLEDLTDRFKQPEAPRQKMRRPLPPAEMKSVPRMLTAPSVVMPSTPHVPTRPVQPFVAPRPEPVTPRPIPLPPGRPAMKPLAAQPK